LSVNVILKSKIVNVLTSQRSHLGPNDLKPLFGEMDSESIVPYPFMYHSVFLKYTTLLQGRVTVTKTKKKRLRAHMFSELRFRSVVRLKRKASRSNCGRTLF
jgi:hypothetical protein